MKINLHTHQYTNRLDVLEIVNQYPNNFMNELPYYSIGIHPWYIEEAQLEHQLSFMDRKLELSQALAVGECGLDKRISKDIEVQMKVFKKQVLLAEKHKKPLILHCVAAYQEMIAVKKELNVSVPMVIHGFSKNRATAEALTSSGFYLSFGKYLLRNPKLEDVLRSIPIEQLFLETDSMDESIYEVYKKATDVLGKDIEEEIEYNFNRVFNRD